MSAPRPEQFAALARSSPWMWSTLRFVVSWRGAINTGTEPVRAWIRRPHGLRVATLGGGILTTEPSSTPWTSRSTLGADRRRNAHPPPHGPLHPDAPGPARDADGFVLQRPVETSALRYDDPMFQDYRWVAMLDPVELANGHGRRWTEHPEPGPTLIEEPVEADHHGRPAWEAVLRPTAAYDPRCACCALLFSAESEARWSEGGGLPAHERNPGLRYPDAHRVRLDVATGVCVLTEELGGSRPGSGHELVIEAVDEQLADDLFLPPRTGLALAGRRVKSWLGHGVSLPAPLGSAMPAASGKSKSMTITPLQR